ncbi:MAG: hypothetical protein NUV82_04175, partial [Candidatus Komeilibacteria bacterium]|nr:hypothetical protein [Candidatus Komeilibacteria bacterium]
MSLRLIRIIINGSGVMVVILATAFFLLHDLGLWGDVRASVQPQQNSPLIGGIYPANRVDVSSAGWHITQEPVYFDVRLPNLYDSVTLTFRYRPDCCQI